MQVSDVMTRDVTVVSPESSVREAARKMDELNIGALPVCDGRRLVGVLTDRDIVVRSTAVGALPDATRVNDVMSEDVRWCFEHDPVEQVQRQMAQMQIRRLPVVDGEKNLVGMVSLGDLAAEHASGVAETLRSISEPSEPDRTGTLTTAGGADGAQATPSAR